MGARSAITTNLTLVIGFGGLNAILIQGSERKAAADRLTAINDCRKA